MIFKLNTVFNKLEMIKTGNQTREINRKYYRKCSNNFDANCTQIRSTRILPFMDNSNKKSNASDITLHGTLLMDSEIFT